MSTGVERANEVVLGRITSCQGCGASDLEPVLDLGHHAPCDSLLTEQMLGEPETHFPLVFCRCTSCGLAQLDYAAPPEVVFFPEYPYRTAMTGLLKEHFWSLTHDVTERLGLGADDLAIDIGSNDGTLLQGFQQEGVRVLGIEPTDIAKIAIENDVPTVQAFFSEEVAEQVRAEHGPAAVVTGTNMFAHVNNLFPELRGVATLIGDDGAFVSESHYLLNLIEELQYDTIYHEHLRFYSLKPMIEIFNRAGFSIFDVERVPTHGGSIRVWADRGKRDVGPRVDDLVRLEEESGLYDGVAFDRFRQRIQDGKLRLLELLVEARKEGPIVGLGAPGRASTLLAYTGVTPELVDSICELTGSLKNRRVHARDSHPDRRRAHAVRAEAAARARCSPGTSGTRIMPKIRERGYRVELSCRCRNRGSSTSAALRVFFIGAHLPLAGHSARRSTVVIREALLAFRELGHEVVFEPLLSHDAEEGFEAEGERALERARENGVESPPGAVRAARCCRGPTPGCCFARRSRPTPPSSPVRTRLRTEMASGSTRPVRTCAFTSCVERRVRRLRGGRTPVFAYAGNPDYYSMAARLKHPALFVVPQKTLRNRLKLALAARVPALRGRRRPARARSTWIAARRRRTPSTTHGRATRARSISRTCGRSSWASAARSSRAAT